MPRATVPATAPSCVSDSALTSFLGLLNKRLSCVINVSPHRESCIPRRQTAGFSNGELGGELGGERQGDATTSRRVRGYAQVPWFCLSIYAPVAGVIVVSAGRVSDAAAVSRQGGADMMHWIIESSLKFRLQEGAGCSRPPDAKTPRRLTRVISEGRQISGHRRRSASNRRRALRIERTLTPHGGTER
jgi:hypothetical protein